MASAVAAHQSGNLASAANAYAQVLQQQPEHADAIHYQGLIAFQNGDYATATARIQAAIALRPEMAAYRVNLGNALKRLGDTAAALQSYDDAVALDPQAATHRFNRALLLGQTGRPRDAIAELSRVLGLAPNWPLAWAELGARRFEEEDIDGALAAYQKALALDARLPGANNRLGHLLLLSGDVEAAIECFRREEELAPTDHAACSSRLFALGFRPSITPEQLLTEHLGWQQRHGDALPRIVRRPSAPHPDGRLRLAYLSGDLRRHAMRFFVRPLLRHHDRSRFSLHVYATHAPQSDDAVTAEFRPLVDHWVNCHAMDDAGLAQRIADDDIDILIDLAGHTSGGRLPALARHPARLQCTMLGYMTTTGVRAIDVRIADPISIPPESNHWFSERIERLPASQWCYAPDPATPPVTALPAMRNQYLSFGAFHNLAKINPAVIDLWSRLLHALPKSRLHIVAWGNTAKQRLRALFHDRGLTSRVELRDPLPHDRYLELYADIDIALDVLPYAGGTVTCEALWMGVPVLTLAHPSPAGRGGASILTAAGLTEWIARDEQDWISRASAFGNNLAELAKRRATLRETIRGSALMDGTAYTAALEALLCASITRTGRP